ncbi:MAG: DUF3253 domain-containing protein [Leptolyngbyaceae bacterium]|nr:DUF3253 domain-containing protein [Leptolyngbyaceae bacterium]
MTEFSDELIIPLAEKDAEAIRQAILEKVAQRGTMKSICPSEVARDIGGEGWRQLMPAIRQIGTALADEGKIVVLQKGAIANPRQVKGPIRYRII